MFQTDGICNEIEVDGKKINIKNISKEELKKYLEILNDKEERLIEEQNEYLSEILK